MFRATVLPAGTQIREGTPVFDQYRSCSLREAERNLFLSASNYRRCLDSLMPSASHWAHVTMYYASWYAAHAILAMFGVSVFQHHVVDVRTGSPGSQELIVRGIGPGPGRHNTTYRGSHERFWDFFYRAASNLQPLLDPRFSPFLSPVSNDPSWLTAKRNEINYVSHTALATAAIFQQTFSAKSFPASLAGPIATQYLVLEGLIEIAFFYARYISLRTDAISSLTPAGPRSRKISKLVFAQRPPAIVSKTKKRLLLA